MAGNAVPLEQLQRETLELAQGFFGTASFVLVAGLALVVLTGLFVVTIAMAPDLTRRTGQAVGERYLASFLTGLPIVAALVAGLAAGHRAPPLGLVAAVVGFYLVALGLTASCESLGRRVFWTAGRMGTRPLHVIVGAAVLAAAGMIPVAGWLMAAYAIVAGLGAVAIGCLRKAPPREPPPIQRYQSPI